METTLERLNVAFNEYILREVSKLGHQNNDHVSSNVLIGFLTELGVEYNYSFAPGISFIYFEISDKRYRVNTFKLDNNEHVLFYEQGVKENVIEEYDHLQVYKDLEKLKRLYNSDKNKLLDFLSDEEKSNYNLRNYFYEDDK